MSLILSIPVIFCPVSRHHGGGFLVGGKILIRVENDGAHLIWLRLCSVKGEVAANKASFAVDHVAVGALRFAEEESFSLFGITGKLNDIASALEDPQIGDDVRHFLWFQG